MLPVEHNDSINAKILAISEDKIEGFVREPFEEIARRSSVDVDVVMAQIAADTLGMPLGQVRVLHGSTPFLDEGYGAFASRSTVLGGSAVFEAANALLAKIRAAAGATS